MDSTEVRRRWARREGEFSPQYYAHRGPDETSESVREVLDAAVGPAASVLELGCSSGRHLAHLHEHGYEDLHGIDVNGDAFDVMAESYPDLADAGTFHAAAIESVAPGFADGRFDAVFSVETLQHVHPADAWVFEDVARIAGDCLVTVENEGTPAHRSPGCGARYVDDGVPLYYRDWGRVFGGTGLEEVASRPAGLDTLREFRRPIDGMPDSKTP